MIFLKRSESDFIDGSSDISHLEYVARRALACGETVELQIEHGPWRPVTTSQEVHDTLHELYDELDARRDADLDQVQLPLMGDAS